MSQPPASGAVAQAHDCVDCGLPIPAGRIEVHPETRHCTRCKSEQARVQARPVAPQPEGDP